MDLFPSRIGRCEFFLRYLALTGGVAGNMFLASLIERMVNPALRISIYVAVAVVGIAIVVSAFRGLLFPRLRDLGLTNAYALLIFLPFVNLGLLLVLLFMPANAVGKSGGSAKSVEDGFE